MRVLILGNSGAGKTTMARVLAEAHGLERLDLDSVVWEPHRVAEARAAEAVRGDLDRFTAQHERWVVEGSYGRWIAHLAPRASGCASSTRAPRAAWPTMRVGCGSPRSTTRPSSKRSAAPRSRSGCAATPIATTSTGCARSARSRGVRRLEAGIRGRRPAAPGSRVTRGRRTRSGGTLLGAPALLRGCALPATARRGWRAERAPPPPGPRRPRAWSGS